MMEWTDEDDREPWMAAKSIPVDTRECIGGPHDGRCVREFWPLELYADGYMKLDDGDFCFNPAVAAFFAPVFTPMSRRQRWSAWAAQHPGMMAAACVTGLLVALFLSPR